MKSLAILWLGAAVLVLAAGGCTSKPVSPAPTFEYVNQRGHFSMTLPRGWAVSESQANVAAIIRSPTDAHGSSIAMIIVELQDAPAGATLNLDTEIANTRNRLQTLPEYKFISEESVVLPDGNKAWIITFESKPNPQAPLIKEQQMQVVAENRAYTVAATTTPENFAVAQRSFDTCLRSFRVGPAAVTPSATGTAK